MHKLLAFLRCLFDTTPHWAKTIIENQERMERRIMTISAEVQTVLDGIKKNTSLVASVDAGQKLMASQITDLQAQIAALQAGGTLSAEDKAALVQGAADLESTNTALAADVPANT